MTPAVSTPSAAPAYRDLSDADKQRVDDAADAFVEALARDPDARIDDFLGGFEGDALGVLIQELAAEAFNFHRARADRETTAGILAQLPKSQAEVVTEQLSQWTTAVGVPRPAAGGPAAVPHFPGYQVLPDPAPKPGGCAVVYFAWHSRLRRTVAIKWPKSADQEVAARFRTEALLQAQLRGAGVPALYEFGYASDRRPFIAMERVEGELLRAHLPTAPRATRFEEADFHRVELIRSVALALAPAHLHSEDGICHLDLSPDNVIVTPTGRVVILDWGLGRQRGAPPADAVVGGTPNYMAPEKARGEVASFGPACDVFSLGCFLHQIQTGQPLFPDAGSKDERIRQAREYRIAAVAERLGEAVARWGVPRELADLTLECLAETPAGRPAHAGEVAGQIAGYLAAAARKQQEGQDREIRRRVRRKWAGIATAVLIVGTTGTWYFARQSQEAQVQAAWADTDRRAEEAGALAGRGQWATAREKYRGLLLAPVRTDADRLDLRLRLLRAEQFLNNRPAVAEELARLREHPLADQFRGRIDFEAAVEALNRSLEHAFDSPNGLAAETNPHELEAERLLARVRDDPAVSDADRWTARGLLAPTAEKAAEHYQEALRLEPFHPYAGPYYLLTCLLAGRLDQALARADAWAEASPRDPLPWFYRASILTLVRHHPEAEEALARLAQAGGDRPLPLDTVQACRAVVKLVRAVDESLPKVAVADGLPLAALLGLVAELKAAEATLSSARSLVLMTLPMSPNQRRAFGRFLAAVQMVRTNPREVAPRLAAVENFVAPGTVLFVRGMGLAWSAPRAADIHEQVRILGQATDCMRAAAAGDRHLWDVKVICRLCVANFVLSASGHKLFAHDAARLSAEGKDQLLTVAREPKLPDEVRQKVRALAKAIPDPGFAEQLEVLLTRRP